MTVEHTGVRLKLEHKQKAKNRDSGEKEEGIKKGKYLPPPSHGALNEKPNMGRDSVEGRTVVVLLKGLYL